MNHKEFMQQTAVTLAAGYACAAHAGQVRKYHGEPYYFHPKRVCDILINHGFDNTDEDIEMLVASLLHDVVEDTSIPLDHIAATFGDGVADMVEALTKIDYSHMQCPPNRDERKRIERQRLAIASFQVKTIKLADRLDNLPDIIKHDEGFAKIFVQETRLLLDEALVGGHQGLWDKVDKIVSDYQKSLA